jgi:polyphosphate kinase
MTTTPLDRAALSDLFRRDVLPVLTPVAVDAAHPFPRLSAGGLALIVETAPRRWWRDRAPPLVVIPIPASVRRTSVLVEDLVRAHVGEVLGAPPVAMAAIRVSRAGGVVRVRHDGALWPRARALLVRALGVAEGDLVAYPVVARRSSGGSADGGRHGSTPRRVAAAAISS